jgi:hypothetical protein
MFEALWPGGFVVLIGAAVLVAAYFVRRHHEWNKLNEEFRDGNEMTGIFLQADIESILPPPEPEPEPTQRIEYFPDIKRLPAPVVYIVALPRDPTADAEKMATPDQRFEAQFHRIRREQAEAWEKLTERHRTEWRTLITDFENHMEWGALVEHGGHLQDLKYG